MVVGNKKFGAVSYVIVGGSGAILPQKIFVFFYPYRTAIFMHFLKQIFGYTALHYDVGLDLQLSTCMICLCKYHNSSLRGTRKLDKLRATMVYLFIKLCQLKGRVTTTAYDNYCAWVLLPTHRVNFPWHRAAIF